MTRRSGTCQRERDRRRQALVNRLGDRLFRAGQRWENGRWVRGHQPETAGAIAGRSAPGGGQTAQCVENSGRDPVSNSPAAS